MEKWGIIRVAVFNVPKLVGREDLQNTREKAMLKIEMCVGWVFTQFVKIIFFFYLFNYQGKSAE